MALQRRRKVNHATRARQIAQCEVVQTRFWQDSSLQLTKAFVSLTKQLPSTSAQPQREAIPQPGCTAWPAPLFLITRSCKSPRFEFHCQPHLHLHLHPHFSNLTVFPLKLDVAVGTNLPMLAQPHTWPDLQGFRRLRVQTSVRGGAKQPGHAPWDMRVAVRRIEELHQQGRLV